MVTTPKLVIIIASQTDPKCFKAMLEGISKAMYYEVIILLFGPEQRHCELTCEYIEDRKGDVVIKADHSEIFFKT